MSYKVRRPLTAEEKNRLGITSELTAHLLFHRGVTRAEKAAEFLSPVYGDGEHDPLLLKDADKAAARIIQAIENDEKIAIYSDYDADGIPGAAMFHDFFRRIGFKNFITYIPHRHDEGFGVNVKAIEQLAEEKVKLIVTIDCGISDIGPIARAKELGMDLIVTDHHEAPPELPSAFAIIDHKQPGCSYPDKNICGSGVAFKLIQAILAKNRFGLKEGHEKWLLDLVGIATLSDMVPLTGENRIFSYYGMEVLRKSPRKGLQKLLSNLHISQKDLTEDDIAFMVTPRINAASRMGAPIDAFKLLTAETDEEAAEAAEHLDRINTERKGVVASLVKEVKKTLRERYGSEAPQVIVLGNPLWRPSLLGLAANSCAEEFSRPVFLWGRDGDNIIRGSCRSEGETHVVNLMRAAQAGTLTQFGGHHHSGGFTVGNESIHYLEQRLNEAFRTMEERKNGNKEEIIKLDAQIPSSPDEDSVSSESEDWIDLELSLDAVNWALSNEIAKLAPFGMGNPKPLFLFKQVVPIKNRRFGKGNEHIELTFKQSKGSTIPAISFFGAEKGWAKTLQAGVPVDLIASIEKSTFRGRPELRLRIADVHS